MSASICACGYEIGVHLNDCSELNIGIICRALDKTQQVVFVLN